MSIRKDKIEAIAIKKYRENGDGITFEDIERGFSVNKGKAQRTLKHFHGIGVLFTANDLIVEGITILKNTSPQQYFPTNIKAEIIEGLSKRKSVLVKPTEVISSNVPLEQQKAQNLFDILSSVGSSPLYIHRIQLQLSLESSGYYTDILEFDTNKMGYFATPLKSQKPLQHIPIFCASKLSSSITIFYTMSLIVYNNTTRNLTFDVINYLF